MQGLLRCKVRDYAVTKATNHKKRRTVCKAPLPQTATYCNVGQRCHFIFVAAFPQSLGCSENHSGAAFLPVNLYFALALKVFYRGWAWERKRSELRSQPALALALNFDGAFPLEVCQRPKLVQLKDTRTARTGLNLPSISNHQRLRLHDSTRVPGRSDPGRSGSALLPRSKVDAPVARAKALCSFNCSSCSGMSSE